MNTIIVASSVIFGLIFATTAVTQIEIEQQDALNSTDDDLGYLSVILALTKKLIYLEHNVTSFNQRLEKIQEEHKAKEKQWKYPINASTVELERVRKELKEREKKIAKIEDKCPVKVKFNPNATGYNYSFGDSLYKIYTKGLLWNDARKVCMQDGAYLGIINSPEEFQVFIRMLSEAKDKINGYTNYEAWIGVHELYEKNDWVTIYGESLSQTGFNQWARNETTQNGLRCVNVINYYSLKGLYDRPCYTNYAFICEMYNGK